MGASAGRVLLIPKGDWNDNTTYTGLDWVRHNGAAWVCKNTCTNIEPTLENTDNWQLISKDGDMVTADTAMSDSSTNAVQNKVIKSYVDDKFSFSYHDTATSGRSFSNAEDGNMLVTDWTKNLLNPTLQTTAQNGITCTNNGDGTYTLNGTATGGFAAFIIGTINLIKGIKYAFCGCPKDGSDTKYRLSVLDIAECYGNTEIFEVDEDITKNISIRIEEGITVSNLIFKPMITTDLSATYDDFVPYGVYEIQSCGKNLLKPALQTITQNGVTCTNNGDGTYTLNGTATDNIVLYLCIPKDSFTKLTKGEEYRAVLYSNILNGLTFDVTNNINEGHSSDEIYGYNFICNEDEHPYGCCILIQSGTVFNNVIIKPMLTTDLSATYDDFEPYTGETITVTNDTESPAFGLKSHKGITHIISPGNVKCVYPTNESGKGVLDAMYNNSQLRNELSKLKNAIIAMGGTV